MMNIEAFKKAYNESRNGTDGWTRHPLAPYFVYSDGVKECAEAGCYWLLDILGTELSKVFRTHQAGFLMVIKVKVADGGARIEGSFWDEEPPQYKRKVDYTDLPEGTWTFFVARGDGLLSCYLLTEH